MSYYSITYKKSHLYKIFLQILHLLHIKQIYLFSTLMESITMHLLILVKLIQIINSNTTQLIKMILVAKNYKYQFGYWMLMI